MLHAKTWIHFTNKQKMEDTKEYITYDPIYINFKTRQNHSTRCWDSGFLCSWRGERSGEHVRGVLGVLELLDLTD